MKGFENDTAKIKKKTTTSIIVQYHSCMDKDMRQKKKKGFFLCVLYERPIVGLIHD